MVTLHNGRARRRLGAAPFALLAAVLVSVTSLGLGFADDGDAAARVDPHGKPDACASCHFRANDDAPGSSREVCIPCHEKSDMHPSDVPVVSAQVPDGWPLENDRVVCATCHAEPSCVEGRGQRAPYLRESPYAREIEFCWRCHPAADYSRSDPHHPTARRDSGDSSCAFCHHELPDDGASPADSHLRAEPLKLCELCHPGAVHAGVVSHLGEVVDEALRGALDPTLGLDAGGEVRCWSCHEVHGDRTTLPPREPTEAPYTFSQVPGPESLWADEPPAWIVPAKKPAHPVLLPLEVGDLCRACHGSPP